MRLNDEKNVKKWLRNLPLVKKELEIKIEFYKELAGDFEGTQSRSRAAEYYWNKIEVLGNKLNNMLSDIERLFDLLDEEERLVMTAKYIKLIRWDFIELHVFYSRRQAIRIHNEAIKKFIGQEVFDL